MSRIDDIFNLVSTALPRQRLLLDGLHFIPNNVDYSLPELFVLDLSNGDIGGEPSEYAILVIDESKPNTYFSEIGLTPLKLLPMSRTILQARKLNGIDPFDETDDISIYHSGF